MSNTFSRFSSKAQIYTHYRWDYAPAAIEAIFQITQISTASTIADIGSGTGMLARHFIGRVNSVFAVEPNPDMRRIAAEALGQAASFYQLDGLAEATALPDQAIDLITVGRAIHWFDPEATRAEFRRILKPGGWLAILQNPTVDQKLLAAVKALRTEEHGWNMAADKDRLSKIPMRFYYGHEDFLKLQFPHTKTETWPEFIGRLSSFSPAPDPGHPLYPTYRNAAKIIFNQFSAEGRITIHIATELYLGRISNK